MTFYARRRRLRKWYSLERKHQLNFLRKLRAVDFAFLEAFPEHREWVKEGRAEARAKGLLKVYSPQIRWSVLLVSLLFGFLMGLALQQILGSWFAYIQPFVAGGLTYSSIKFMGGPIRLSEAPPKEQKHG